MLNPTVQVWMQRAGSNMRGLEKSRFSDAKGLKFLSASQGALALGSIAMANTHPTCGLESHFSFGVVQSLLARIGVRPLQSRAQTRSRAYAQWD